MDQNMLNYSIKLENAAPWRAMYTSGLLRLAGVHDPPEACDIPINVEFDGDYHGGSGVTGNG